MIWMELIGAVGAIPQLCVFTVAVKLASIAV
jgi:hypothetical protein